jgi:hypothetical protein
MEEEEEGEMGSAVLDSTERTPRAGWAARLCQTGNGGEGSVFLRVQQADVGRLIGREDGDEVVTDGDLRVDKFKTTDFNLEWRNGR